MKGSEVRVFDFREEDTTRHGRGKSDDKKHVILLIKFKEGHPHKKHVILL